MHVEQVLDSSTKLLLFLRLHYSVVYVLYVFQDE